MNALGKLAVVAAAAALITFYGCRPVFDSAIIGTFESNRDSDGGTIEVRPDGTYMQWDGSKLLASGKWQLVREHHIEITLDLFNAYALPLTPENLALGKGITGYSVVPRHATVSRHRPRLPRVTQGQPTLV